MGVFNSSCFLLSTDIFEQLLIVRLAPRQAGIRSTHLHPTLVPKTHNFASESPRNDQGTLKNAVHLYNAHTGKKAKLPRLVRMHSDEIEVCISIPSSKIRSNRLTRMSILSDLVKFTRCLVLNACLGILSRMVRVTSPWYVNLMNIWILLMPIPKASIFVPEPVIPLSIKPKGPTFLERSIVFKKRVLH